MTLTLFKEIQALGWLNFVTGADLLWLVSPRIQQPTNKCRMVRTIFAQSVQVQSSTRKNTLPCEDLLWLVSPRIPQPTNKCRMVRTISAQSVQVQNSTRKNILPCQEPLYFFLVYFFSNLDWVWMSLFISSMGLSKLLPKLIW